VPAAAGRAHDEQVVAFALDADGEFDRIGGAFLAGDAPYVLDFIGRGKAELLRIAAVREFLDRKGRSQAHVDTLAALVSRRATPVRVRVRN
jgi:hypothetical protein